MVVELADWTEGKRYEKAINTSYGYIEVPEVRFHALCPSSDGINDKSYHFYTQSASVWQCLRGIDIHEGPREVGPFPGYGLQHKCCGKECEKSGEGKWVRKEVSTVSVLTRRVAIDFDALD